MNRKYKNRNRIIKDLFCLIFVEYPEAGADMWLVLTYDTYNNFFLTNFKSIHDLAKTEPLTTTEKMLKGIF